MAAKNFNIANGVLTVIDGNGWVETHSADYRARLLTDGIKDQIIIYPVNVNPVQAESRKIWFVDWTVDTLGFSGATATPATIDEWVSLFNAVCGTNIGYNTKYPESMFSQTINLDTSVDEQVVPIWCQTGHNGGYITLTTPSTNTGNIYVGENDVNNTCYYLEPDKSITLEASDLSTIWVQSALPNQVIMVLGYAKI